LRDLIPLELICLYGECEFAPVKLACYECLMVVNMFFKPLPSGNKNRPLPNLKCRYSRAYTCMCYDDITFRHRMAQLGRRKAYMGVYVQARGIGAAHLPEHIGTVRNNSDELFQQSPEAEASMHSQRDDHAARTRGLRHRERTEPIED